jgi:hypothetical protein
MIKEYFTIVLIIIILFLLGLSIVRIVDKKLSEIQINVPPLQKIYKNTLENFNNPKEVQKESGKKSIDLHIPSNVSKTSSKSSDLKKKFVNNEPPTMNVEMSDDKDRNEQNLEIATRLYKDNIEKIPEITSSYYKGRPNELNLRKFINSLLLRNQDNLRPLYTASTQNIYDVKNEIADYILGQVNFKFSNLDPIGYDESIELLMKNYDGVPVSLYNETSEKEYLESLKKKELENHFTRYINNYIQFKHSTKTSNNNQSSITNIKSINKSNNQSNTIKSINKLGNYKNKETINIGCKNNNDCNLVNGQGVNKCLSDNSCYCVNGSGTFCQFGPTYYLDPKNMTEKQQFKFKYKADLLKMTIQDYKNWLSMFSDDLLNLPKTHLQNYIKLMNGEIITKQDIPTDVFSPPKNSQDYFELISNPLYKQFIGTPRNSDTVGMQLGYNYDYYDEFILPQNIKEIDILNNKPFSPEKQNEILDSVKSINTSDYTSLNV